ncbi:MAG: hypothetical protein ABJF09_00525 [Qipengyuania citrea]|uniref:hypothetical protein n=1 Tax=Qipengyuania citrea TaxID=225971 RepID=UPI00326752AA
MDDFDPKDLLKNSAGKLAPKLGSLTFAQLQVLDAAERGVKEPRKNMLETLQGEIAARREANPGVALSSVSVARLAAILNLASSETPYEELPDDDRALVFEGVSEIVEGTAPPPHSDEEAAFRRVVGGVVPLLLEIEQLQGQRVREVIAEGDMASDGERQAETLVKDIHQLAVCDKDGEVLFRITPEPGEIQLRGGKAVFNRAVDLVREKPRVAVRQVVALDENGRRVARVRWSVDLIGGGGKLATIPAGYIAFSL